MQGRQALSGLRFIGRRLQVIKRPTVWGPTLIVIATAIVFVDYWRSYSQVNLARQTVPEDASNSAAINLNDPNLLLSDEDRAIAADIDTLPLLLNDFRAPAIEISPSPEVKPAESPVGLPGSLPSTLPAFPTQSDPARSTLANPFDLPQATVPTPAGLGTSPLSQPLSQPFPRSPGGAVVPSLSGVFSMPIPAVSALEPSISSPLQQSLQRRQLQIPLEHTQGLPLGTAPFPSAPSLQTQGPSGVPNAAALEVAPYRLPAQTSPPLGTTGYTLPPPLQVNPSSNRSIAPVGLPESTLPLPSPMAIPQVDRP